MTGQRSRGAADDHSMTARRQLCSASVDHAAIKLDDYAWLALPLDGIQTIEASGDEPAEELELRRCACGSTLGRIRKCAEINANPSHENTSKIYLANTRDRT